MRPDPNARRQTRLLVAILVIWGTLPAYAQFEDPFHLSTDLSKDASGYILSLSFSVPQNHYLYRDKITVTPPAGVALEPLNKPEATRKGDPVTGEQVYFFATDVRLEYRVTGTVRLPLEIHADWQGCDDTQCFFPQNRRLLLTPAGAAAGSDSTLPKGSEKGGWRRVAERFTVAGKASGYLKPDEFIAFLDGRSVADGDASENVLQSFREKGILLTIALIFLGGLALNLTPCVLPMIPINLAIIGAGAQAGSRKRGFALGAAYGAGIAAVYGILGLTVVLAGARFGQLNSSPWFNLGITILFLILSLAMFGIFNLDFTRFHGNTPAGGPRRGGFLPAFLMGGIAALLAGACVAPAVIGVLALSLDLYQRGNVAALVLPFLLGIGMAIPWPFAGAGLSFLPKPGRWMERVKQGFGIIILVAALFYAYQTHTLFAGKGQAAAFAALLTDAEKTGKPVLVDFWATWCKNCAKMEKTTFHEPGVEKWLKNFALVKYQAEDLNDAEVKAILTYYGVIGLPTYVILAPSPRTTDDR